MKELEEQAKKVQFDSALYWKLRATYLEKYLDPTYSEEERDNCYKLFRILKHRE